MKPMFILQIVQLLVVGKGAVRELVSKLVFGCALREGPFLSTHKIRHGLQDARASQNSMPIVSFLGECAQND